jgi:hypothetical protein
MRKILTISFILGLITLVSCGGPEQETAPKQTWTPELDQPSELAQIMRDMHAEATNRKHSLEQGQLDPTLSETLFSMITANPTKPHMKGEGFEPYAKSFIGIYNQIHGAEEIGVQIQAHNNMVDACIACHTQFCDGPISRMEKWDGS